MEIIKNNPYRISGLLVGASAKEQNTQVKKLKMYLSAGEHPNEDYYLPIIGSATRDIDALDNATSRLNLDKDRLEAALFWFYNGNNITDEPAFELLKEGNKKETVSIWAKKSNGKAITKNNSSAFHNLSILILNDAFQSNIDINLLRKGITWKLRYLDSPYYKEIKLKSTDSTFAISQKDIQLLFLKYINKELQKYGEKYTDDFLQIINENEFIAKDDFLREFVDHPIKNIEKKIEASRTKRNTNKGNGILIANQLFEGTSSGLLSLKNILGINNSKFTSISDKVALEILQCGIDYFTHYKDSSTDPGPNTMKVFHMAKSLCYGNIAKLRVNENTQNLQGWIDDKPEREREEKVAADLQIITTALDSKSYIKFTGTVSKAKAIIDTCKPRLTNIKSVLGGSDDFYIQVSSAVVNKAQDILVGCVNIAQDSFNNEVKTGMPAQLVIDKLIKIVVEAYDIMNSLSNFDMNSSLKSSFSSNKLALLNIKNEVNALKKSFNIPVSSSSSYSSSASQTSSTSSPSSSSSGCYIATMAYGNYDHPQVVELRNFRDKILSKYWAGRCFIKIYYKYSPKLVERLKDKPIINTTIRQILNHSINVLKK